MLLHLLSLSLSLSLSLTFLFLYFHSHLPFSFLRFSLLKENVQILRDLSLLQIQMRDMEGFCVRPPKISSPSSLFLPPPPPPLLCYIIMFILSSPSLSLSSPSLSLSLPLFTGYSLSVIKGSSSSEVFMGRVCSCLSHEQ